MVKRRRFWSCDEKCRIVAQTRVPGISVSQVARRYDVNANLVFKWLRDPRFKPRADDEGASSFLPVEIVTEPAGPIIEPEARNAEIEIVLSNGHRLCVRGVFDPDAVLRLVRGLSR